jgi:predicted RNase H-like HicB family nuclease
MIVRYQYPATLEAEDGGRFTAYFDGLPGATWGRSREEALANAKDLLVNALEMLIEDRVDIPPPVPADGRPLVEADVETPARA